MESLTEADIEKNFLLNLNLNEIHEDVSYPKTGQAVGSFRGFQVTIPNQKTKIMYSDPEIERPLKKSCSQPLLTRKASKPLLPISEESDFDSNFDSISNFDSEKTNN